MVDIGPCDPAAADLTLPSVTRGGRTGTCVFSRCGTAEFAASKSPHAAKHTAQWPHPPEAPGHG
jgi:hypothetical protein